MQTQEIPREQWHGFFDSFSREHEGWLATLEFFSIDLGAQEEAHELPFEGISVDSGDQSVVINLAQTTQDNLTHTIDQPTRVWLQENTEGTGAALEIEANDNSKTLLSFRSPLQI